MKAGVRIGPWVVWMTPVRARPSRAPISKRRRCGSWRISAAYGSPARRTRSGLADDQGSSCHRLRLLDPEQLQGGRGDVSEDPAVTQLNAVGGDDERHRVERVRGVGRAVGLEHVVAVAVV